MKIITVTVMIAALALIILGAFTSYAQVIDSPTPTLSTSVSTVSRNTSFWNVSTFTTFETMLNHTVNLVVIETVVYTQSSFNFFTVNQTLDLPQNMTTTEYLVTTQVVNITVTETTYTTT